MLNKRMEEKLDERTCIDVRRVGVEVEPGVFELFDFIEGVDYCDAQNEAYIWSIGKDGAGRILASTDTRFYMNPEYTCLWLR